MPIVYQKWIMRQDLRNNPDKVYVFGDNVQRRGFGGQAKEMRDEPNAIGVRTKYRPDMQPTAFFADDAHCRLRVDEDLLRVQAALDAGKTVVVPADGIGTGYSRLPEVAPKLDAYIKDWFACR